MKKYIFVFIGLLFMSTAFSQEKKDKLDPQVLEQWKKNMEFGISDQRSKTIKQISQSKSSEAYYLIENALLSDFNSGVRGDAAYTLVSLKIDKSDLWTKALSKEKNTEVLRRIVFAISELKISGLGRELFLVLTNYIDKPEENYLSAATVRALGEIKYTPASQFIYALLTNFAIPAEIRSASAIAIGDIGTDAELDHVQFIVENPGEDKAVRMYSAFALGKSGNKKYIDILFNIIANDKEDQNVRLYSIAGLEYIKDPSVEDRLIELCKVDHKSIRVKAIETLGKMKSEKAKAILIYKAKYDPEFEVIKAAKKALQNMDVDLDKLSEEEKKKSETAGK